jgi:hypothetical protein
MWCPLSETTRKLPEKGGARTVKRTRSENSSKQKNQNKKAQDG